MSDEQQKEKRPLSMTRRYRRGLVIVGLLCMMVTLAIATVLFQRSYTVRVDKYLSQICDSVAAGYKAQPTHDAVFNDTAPTEIYTLSLHDALPI